MLQSGGSVADEEVLGAVGGCYNNAPPMSGVRNSYEDLVRGVWCGQGHAATFVAKPLRP